MERYRNKKNLNEIVSSVENNGNFINYIDAKGDKKTLPNSEFYEKYELISDDVINGSDYTTSRHLSDLDDKRHDEDSKQSRCGHGQRTMWFSYNPDTDEIIFNNGEKQEKVSVVNLKGNDGKNGKSAFELWKESHPEFLHPTKDDFFKSLKGKDGDNGTIWTINDNGFWCCDGKPTNKCAIPTAKDGENGKSAFEIWKNLSPDERKSATEADFLRWLASQVEEKIDAKEGASWIPNVIDGKVVFVNNRTGDVTDAYPIQGKNGKSFAPKFVEGKLTFVDDDGHEVTPRYEYKGKTSFELWLELPGNENKTLKDFLDFLKGEKGETGDNGVIGPEGPRGPEGKQGPTGPKGEDADLWKPQISEDGNYLVFVNQKGEKSKRFKIRGAKGDTGGEGPQGVQGPAGPVFIPSVNADGDLSWSNNGGTELKNPPTRNIKGDKGDKGDKGATFHPVVKDGVLYWYEDNGNCVNGISPVRITGAQGKQGERGKQGLSAYEIWRNQGNLGTEQDFLDSLKGEKGTPAPPANFSFKDVEDYTCKVQKINTNLIVDSEEPTDSPEEIIRDRTEEIKKLREEGHKPENQKKNNVGWFKKFTWWCAGVDKDLLTMCPADHSKYVGVGTVILFTALMAWFSSFIAMRLVFGVADEDVWNLGSLGAAVFAVFWASMIFFLDRFITNTMYSDGKVTISKQEFICGLPRIIIAIFLGIVISAPLELIIFDKEIKTELKDELEIKAVNRIRNKEAHKNDTLAILAAEGVEKDLKDQYNKTLKNPNDSAYYITNNHTVSAGQKPAQYQDIKTKKVKTVYVSAGSTVQTTKEYKIDLYREQCSRDSNNLAKAIEKTQLLRKKLISTDSTLLKNFKDSIDVEIKKQGLYANLRALHSIAMKDYHEWTWCGETLDVFLHAWWWYLFNTAIGLIMLLFILIDISPVLYKMMLADGNYDNYLHQEKLLAQDKIRLSLSNMLKKLNESELQRVAPFIMGDIYEKMAGDSYVYKTEEQFKNEMSQQRGACLFWRIWPFSLLRWLFYKEKEYPSAPVIIMESKKSSDNQQEQDIQDVNKAVFAEVLDMKKKIILASYRRWYKTQHDCIICDDVDDENKGREPFEENTNEDEDYDATGDDSTSTNNESQDESTKDDDSQYSDDNEEDNEDQETEEDSTETSDSSSQDSSDSDTTNEGDDERESPNDDGDDIPNNDKK